MNRERIAHFEEIRMNNKKIIRNSLRDYEQISKTRLAKKIGLSFPTVSTAIGELVDSGEVLELDETRSNGGRPGAEYRLNPDFQYALCIRIERKRIIIKVYDALGNMKKEVISDIDKRTTPEDIVNIIKVVIVDYPRVTTIVFGIPGVVWQGKIKYLPVFSKLENVNLKEYIENQIPVSVFLENDVNSIIFAERKQWRDLGHIFITEDCLGAAILINGQIIRGSKGFAGELEFICESAKEKIKCFVDAVIGITCVVDLSDIAISEKDLTEKDIELIINETEKRIPTERIPNIHLVENTDQLYEKGLWDIALEEWLKK